MKQAWIMGRKFTKGYIVQIGTGRFDYATRTLASAVKLARGDKQVRTIHLPMTKQ